MLSSNSSGGQNLRKRSANGMAPDTLYMCCMRIVTRNLATFDPDVLRMLPALIKTQVLRNVTRQPDTAGARFIPALQSAAPVSVSGASNASNRAEPPAATGDGSGGNVRLLQCLLHRELLQLDLSAAGDQLTADQLAAIVREAPNLRELKLSGCTRLRTDDLLDALSRLPHLRALHAPAVPAMADEVVQMLAARCPGLEVLDVSRCERIGDGGAEALRGMRMKKLNVAHTAITDSFLRQMADSRFNEHLDEINLGGCSVTSEGLKHLRWDKLKYIGFEGAHLTDMEFVKKLGNLKFIQWTIST